MLLILAERAEAGVITVIITITIIVENTETGKILATRTIEAEVIIITKVGDIEIDLTVVRIETK